MTVSTEISSNEYTGNGVTTDFDYKFRIFKANQLSVITSDADGDNVVTLRLGTDYTVTNANNAAGGKVILTKPLTNGHKISIARDIPITQETSFRNQSKFFAETHEDAFDYLTMIVQRIWGSLGSLYLKRPNILANWFDAKGYRIANLGKPKRDSDAVDLGTLKDEIEGVNSTILKKEKRTLRVDDIDIPALPEVSERRNRQIGFDNSGIPTLLDPAETGVLGYAPVDSFEKGATLTSRYQVLFWEEKRAYFRWDGKLPKVIPPNSTPNETGGIKSADNSYGLWVDVGDASLRGDLSKQDSTVKIGGVNAEFLVKSAVSGGVPVSAYPDFFTACMNEPVVIVNENISIDDTTIPDNAKIEVLKIQNATLRLRGYDLVFNLKKDLVIDMTNNGVIHLGLKKTLVTNDFASGVNVITVNDTSELKVGDNLATSTIMGKWNNDVRGPNDAYNFIQLINGNTLTMLNSVDAGKTLYRNTWLGNARFGKAGLSFNGNANVTIMGGEIKEAKAGYYFRARENIQAHCIDVKFNGQFLDGFEVTGKSSIYFTRGSIKGSYDPAKQLVAWDSEGDITFDGTQVHRGNFDVEVYHSVENMKHGKLKFINGARFNGSSLLPLKPDQPDTINGGTVGEHVTYLTDSLHVHTMPSGSVELIEFGSDCVFENYMRGATGTTYSGARGNISIGELRINNSHFDCAPFYFKKNTFNISIGAMQLNDVSVKRGWEGNYYPLGYTEGKSVIFGGITKVNPNNLSTDNEVPREFIFDTLDFSGAGLIRLRSSAKIQKAISNGANVSFSGTVEGSNSINLVTLNDGVFSGISFMPEASLKGIYFSQDTDTFESIAILRNQSGAYHGVIKISPHKSYGGTAGLCGDIVFNITNNGPDVVVGNPSTSMLTQNSARWYSAPIGVDMTGSNATVKVKLVNEVLMINIKSQNTDIGVTSYVI
ncbi:hypothetical protein [Providencia rettgeri]|uniref:tail fiber/spike domain-containing protein n=1 Tax=Providencia rettgeri TaxID=587 RepID=UPI0025A830FD|nr:hypothetical protein [Providencia rettgeri]ELR5223812.1 hypothetical protein [Providencia rettgeri]MDX7324079.1 hypothetical protein [Providencia rettgeri]